MSARLSRRFGHIGSIRAMQARLNLAELRELDSLTLERTTEFEDLPVRYQQVILAVEREVYGEQAEEIVARHFGPPPSRAGRQQPAA